MHVICDLSGGGAERIVLDLCRRSSAGVEPEVVTVLPGGALAPAFAEAGIPVRWMGRRPGRPGVRALARLKRWVGQVDVVHTHLWAGHVWGAPAARLARRPWVSTEHNSRADGPGRARVARWARGGGWVVAVSDAVRSAVIEAGHAPSRVEVIPNGVDLERLAPRRWPRGTPRALFLGRLVPQKGLDVLLRALEDVPGLHLDVAGEGPDRGRLEELAEPLGERVRFLGWRSDVVDLLADHHLLVVPSRWEGFGLTVVEALACGRPVVATQVDILPELVGEAGLLVPPEDPVALASALRRLCASPADLRALGKLGPAQAAPYGVDGMVRRYEALYAELAEERGRG